MATVNKFGVFPVSPNSFEKNIIEAIHAKYLQTCCNQLQIKGSLEIRCGTLFRKCSKLPIASQTYLQSKGCSKNQYVEVTFKMEEIRQKIEGAFTAGLKREEAYYCIDGYSEMFENPLMHLGYRFTYSKPSLESKGGEKSD